MKNIRKLLCAILAAALLILTALPALAEIEFDSSPVTVYLSDKEGSSYVWADFSVWGLEKDSKITDVKSSNKKVVQVYSVQHSQGKTKYTEEDREDSEWYDAYIENKALKAGTATVSFKVDGTTYKKKITVKGYTNPVKSLVLTGVSSANQKSKFAKGDYANIPLKKNAKAGYLKVSAASGWKIRRVYWYDRTDDDWDTYRQFSSGKGVASVKMPVPAMKKTGRYNVEVEFVNTKTGGTKYINLYYND